MIPRSLIAGLLLAAVALPMAALVLLGSAGLLTAMQDLSAATAVNRLALACGIAWIVDLVVLLFVLGVNTLVPPPSRSPRREEMDDDDRPETRA